MSKYLSKKALLVALGMGLGLGLAAPSFAVGPSDSEITARVREHLAGVDSLKGADIGVKTADGVVTLSGTVKDPHAKFAAAQAAISVVGVRVLDDELKTGAERRQVADAKSERSVSKHSPRDERITADVKQLLAVNLPSRYQVDVKTTDGVVYLRGDLQSQDAVDRIKGLVAQVDGVKSVNAVGLDSPYVTMVW